MKEKNESEKTASWSHLLKKKREQNKIETENIAADKESKTLTFHIRGMTCTSCELRIEKMVKKLPGIEKALVNYAGGSLIVHGENINPDTIIETVNGLGYSAAIDTKEKKKSNEPFSILQLIGIGIIIAAIWLILDKLGVFNMIPQVSQNMGYGILFVVGLITGLHCIAMCGGINLSQSIKQCAPEENLTVTTKLQPGLLYNLGRVISYTVIGGIVGAIGSVVSISGSAQGIVVVIAGGFMVIIGLNMLNLFPWLRNINIRMPKLFGEKINKSKSSKGPFIVGLLNGLMPCGPLQAMQLYALGTGSFFAGALSMFLFSVGTVPVMLGFSAISSLLSGKFTNKMAKVSAMLVMLLGVAMVGRGLSLNGIAFGAEIVSVDTTNVAQIEGNVQTVTTTMYPSSYEPLIVQQGVPLRWTINVPPGSLNGCNNPMTIPSLGIRKKLQEGDNIIEFTPVKAGNITYTCWMGMITSVIKVVDNINQVSREDIQEIAQASTSTYDTTTNPGTASVAEINGDTQTVVTELLSSRYEPIIVEKGIPVKWTFNATAQELSSCNNRIIIKELNIEKELKAGANLIEFTPEKTGKIPYTCWMGMIKSVILVVDDLNKVDESTIKDAASSVASGSCCSSGSGSCGSGLQNTGTLFKIDINTDDIRTAEIINGVQYATISVDEKGYSPAVIVMQRGIPTEWNFKTVELTDANYRMEFPAYRVRLELKDGDNTINQFLPQTDFTYNSWQKDFSGFVAVEDDLADVDFKAIRDRVDNYVPPAPAGGGGCCGG